MGANWAFQLYRDEAAFDRARAAIRRASAVRRKQRARRFVPDVDEGAARRTLRDQIAKLERELASLFVSAYPRGELDWQVSSPGGPRVLDVGDLEALRDELAARVEDARRELAARADADEAGRERIEALVADPGEPQVGARLERGHRRARAASTGTRPRVSACVGMLMGWWRVKISSGCP